MARRSSAPRGAARADGHELFLEVPLEPFDYPDNDPGPETLLTGQPPRANLDKLYWLMARFGGYVGLINHMGARFTASAADFAPGDGRARRARPRLSRRRLAPTARSRRSSRRPTRVPFGRADLMLDANPSRAADPRRSSPRSKRKATAKAAGHRHRLGAAGLGRRPSPNGRRASRSAASSSSRPAR